jgi:hypothetical protein
MKWGHSYRSKKGAASEVLCSEVERNTVQCSAVQCSAVQCCAVEYNLYIPGARYHLVALRRQIERRGEERST